MNLAGANFAVSLLSGFHPSVGDSFTILANDGSDEIGGTFAGLAQGATFLTGGDRFQISYTGGDGNDIVLTAIAATIDLVGTPVHVPAAPGRHFILIRWLDRRGDRLIRGLPMHICCMRSPAMAPSGPQLDVRCSAAIGAKADIERADQSNRSHSRGVRELRVRGTSRGAAPDHRRSAW